MNTGSSNTTNDTNGSDALNSGACAGRDLDHGDNCEDEENFFQDLPEGNGDPYDFDEGKERRRT